MKTGPLASPNAGLGDEFGDLGVLFMSSAENEAMEGGEFALYSDLAFNNDRKCHQSNVEKTFPYRHNQGVVFLNSNTGFHGPMSIRSVAGLRKWIYSSISSCRDIWKATPAAKHVRRRQILMPQEAMENCTC